MGGSKGAGTVLLAILLGIVQVGEGEESLWVKGVWGEGGGEEEV